MPVDCVELTRRLIDIPSVTDEEAAVGEFLDAELRRAGFRVERQEVAAGRFNLFASGGGTPRVVFNTHLDTVPPWFESSEEEQFIYGRGACDAKGIIAAMVAAGERLLSGRVKDFALLFVVGEETDSIGAKKANEYFAGRGSAYIVVGEPTESRFASASKGALSCTVRFEGVAAHSAYPERGDSAITKLAAAIREIEAAPWGEDELLGKTTANVGVVRGGEKANVIPAWAECDMIFRTAGDPQSVLVQIERLVAQYGGRVIRSHGNMPQHMTVPEGSTPVVVAFNTDVPHLRGLGEPLLYGPGSILDAHGESERISKRELLDAVDTYHDVALQLLGRGARGA
ncbi:MAG TPA: M20/M25/M40 family metallo-hydrolase [Thermoanaerobaculia bacterium]|nr:M20/M25/M40 family metallo-hydrolase [Thermoanaerobaculia bacterium]